MQAAAYVGNDYQLGGTRHYRLTDGVRDGCRCIDVRTGGGLEYTVVCDRGMDLSLASFRGVNLVYLTENAEAHPAFYDAQGSAWLRTFSAGLLTTCGPSYLGDPCEDAGEQLGLHGRFSAIPAQRICDETDLESGVIRLTGQIVEACPFGEKLSIRRTISSALGGASVTITDEIRSRGDRPTPLTMLYHVNFGFPFLDESTEFLVPSACCSGYGAYSDERLEERFHMKPPAPENREKNFLHTFGAFGRPVRAWVWNRKILGGVAVYLSFHSQELPYMTQWMLENARDYVAALEPANVPCLPRSELRRSGLLPMLEPGQTVRLHLELGVVEGNEAIRSQVEQQ